MSEDPIPGLLADLRPNLVQAPTPGPVHGRSSAAAKIALFRALFRGRDDVYPRRFESRKTGKAGYQPACGHEWFPGLCEKPRVKCSSCRH